LAKNAVLSSATTMRSFIQLQEFAIIEDVRALVDCSDF